MTTQKTPLAISSEVFKPILIRAGVALFFGLSTVFVQNPGLTWMKVAFALFLVFSGSALWEYLRRDCVPEAMRSPLSLAAAAWMLGTVLLFFFGTPGGVGLTVTAALILGGVAELVAAGAVRKNQPVKVLGDGEISVAVTLTVDKVSASAKSKIEAAGGSVSEAGA